MIKKILTTILIVLFHFLQTGRAVGQITTPSITLKTSPGSIKDAKSMPLYGQWQNFTSKEGLPSDKTYTVRIIGDSVLVGTHEGLAVYNKGKWHVYSTMEGLVHNGVISIDYSSLTGDIWIGTFGGLSRWSGGKFENFSQFNSGLPNDLVYCVYCDGNDVWVATGGGAGLYHTFTKEWEIFTEQNAPMHEPWTYGISTGNGKAYIAAWGGGMIEYDLKTKHFRDFTDPDGFMEIDLQPDDGLVHDITTATSFSGGIVWISTYFGMSMYDGKNWKGYFDHDSGLASNFINFLRAVGPVVYICSDKGLSTFDGETWVTYARDANDASGRVLISHGKDVTNIKEIRQSPSISHSFTIGVDAKGEDIWIATSKGVSHGIKEK